MDHEDGVNHQQYQSERHPDNLDSTKDELRRLISQTVIELSQLHDSVIANGHKGRLSQFDQVDVMIAAFDESRNSESFLPFRQSALPAIMALRHTYQIILQSCSVLEDEQTSLDTMRHQLEADVAFLRDQEALSHTLQQRIGSLQLSYYSSNANSGLETCASLEMLRSLKAAKTQFDVQSRSLFHDTNRFIINHLSNMLAVEDLGGPVVGDWADVDDDVLAAGFNSQAKSRKSTERVMSDGMRQMRLDQVWRQVDTDFDRQAGRHHDNDSAASVTKNKETSAASHEIQVLLQALLNDSMEASNHSASYVQIKEESAAARFLVRAKVAQLHPRDATRLRLVDFGRELED